MIRAVLRGLERLVGRGGSEEPPDTPEPEPETGAKGLASEAPPADTGVRAALNALHQILNRLRAMTPGLRRRLADDPDLFLLVAVVTAVVVVIEAARPPSGNVPDTAVEDASEGADNARDSRDEGLDRLAPSAREEPVEGAPATEPIGRISEPVRRAEALVRVSSGEIRAEAGTEVVLAVRLSGTRGRPVVNEVIRWRVEGGDGAIAEPRARTDVQGIARARVRLPEAPGPVRVVASVRDGDLPEVRFRVTAVARRP